MAANTPEKNPIVAFILENKIIIGIVSVVVIALAIYTFTSKGETAEPTPTPTVSSSAVLDEGGGTAPAPAPTSSAAPGSPTSTETGTNSTKGPQSTAKPSLPVPTASPTPVILGSGPQAPEATDWRPAAEGFAKAWTNPEGGKEAWLKRMKPYLTPQLENSFSHTVISNIYTDTLSSVSLIEDNGAYVVFTATYKNNGTLLQGMIQLQGNGDWLVDSVSPPEN